MLNDSQRQFINALAKVVGTQNGHADKRKLKKNARLEAGLHLNPYHAKLLRQHRPSYWTEVGLVTCTLHDVTASQINGETIGYYDLSYIEPDTGARMTRRYIYAIRFGQPKEIYKHEWRRSR